MAGAHPKLPRSLAGDHNPWLIAVVVSLATFMEVLDTSIANVSLRHIAGSMSVSLTESTWVLTSYLVANAIILPISGWLSAVIGRKRFYLACVFLFTLSSLICALSPTLGWLIACRVLQGLAGGGLAPSSLSMLRDSFPDEKSGMVFALYGVVTVAAPALGPTLGGYLTDTYSWHWIFLINVPVGAIAFVLSALLLVEPPIETRERAARWARGVRVDYIGFGLVALGLGLLQIVLDKGEQEDWFASSFITVASGVSVAALALLVVRELNTPDPIVDLELFANRSFAAAALVRLATFAVLLGTTQLIPQLVQTQLGYTAMQAGLVITPGAFIVIAMMPLVGFSVNRVQPRLLIGIGIVALALSLWHMGSFTTSMDFAYVMWARCVQAAAVALLIVPGTSVAYVGIAGHKSSNASALINLARNIGGSFGISLAQTWLARRTQFHQLRLAEHVLPTSQGVQAVLRRLSEHFSLSGEGPVQAHRQALGALYAGLQHQARMLAFNDIFYGLAAGSLLVLPCVLLLGRVRRV